MHITIGITTKPKKKTKLGKRKRYPDIVSLRLSSGLIV